MTLHTTVNHSRTEPIWSRIAERWYVDKRLKGLTRFAIAITFLNILGHVWLGFEQSWITPFVALGAAYGTEFFAEFASSRSENRKPRYLGTPGETIAFFLSAHITALAVGMLLYAAEQLWVIAFASSLAVASKWLFQVVIINPNGTEGTRHFLNPSNFGITVTLLIFPSVGIAPPYMFTENISGWLDWLLPCVIVLTGSLLNTKLTGRMILITAWLVAFFAQAVLRSYWNDTSLVSVVMPMTGFAFILFTFYMITDPATTPSKPLFQIIFASSVAALYAVFMELHIVFGLFYALTLTTLARGILIWRKIPTRPQILNTWAKQTRDEGFHDA